MERMKKVFESMLDKMNEKEKEMFMEHCLLFMRGQASGKDRERDAGKTEETACPPGMSRLAGCCPEMMEQFFHAMRSCLAEKGKEAKKGTVERTEGDECCSG